MLLYFKFACILKAVSKKFFLLMVFACAATFSMIGDTGSTPDYNESYLITGTQRSNFVAETGSTPTQEPNIKMLAGTGNEARITLRNPQGHILASFDCLRQGSYVEIKVDLQNIQLEVVRELGPDTPETIKAVVQVWLSSLRRGMDRSGIERPGLSCAKGILIRKYRDRLSELGVTID